MFITFEGIDGSGKSTQIQLLKKRLSDDGRAVEVFRDPGGTETSERVREVLLKADLAIHPVTELLLFSSARAQLISEKVNPLLKKNTIVILDRYYDSTIAYQGYGRSSLPVDDIHQLNQIASHHTVPDVTFYLKISLEDAQKRTALQLKDRMEQAGTPFYEKVIEGFDAIAKQEDRFITINAMQKSEQIHQVIWENIYAKL